MNLEEAKLQAQITELQQKLAQSETENKTMGSNNVWLNNKYGELEKKLARYENPDYVLVPRNLSNELWEVVWKEFELSESMHEAHKAMIKAVEKDND